MAGSLLEIAQAYAAGLPTIGAIRLDGDLVRVDLRPGEPEGFSFVRGYWEGELLLLAVHRQLASNAAVPGLTSAWAGLLFSAPGQDGPTGGSSGGTSTPPAFELRVTTRSRGELTAAILAGARELGLIRPTVEWLRVGDLDALVIVATARSPRLFLERWDWVRLFDGSIPRLFGMYLELRDHTDAPFMALFGSRFSGGSWYRDDVGDLRSGGPAPLSSQLLRRIEVARDDEHLSVPRTARRRPEARAFAAAEGAIGLRALPPPAAQPASCARPLVVTLTFEDGHVSRYGPCRLPAPARLAGEALLRVHRLAGCSAPSPLRDGAIRIGPYRLSGFDDERMAMARTTPAGRLVLPLVPLAEPRRRLELDAWPCEGDPGGSVGQRPYAVTRDDARRRPLPIGADPATAQAVVARIRRSGLYRLYLHDHDGRFLGTAVIHLVRP